MLLLECANFNQTYCQISRRRGERKRSTKTEERERERERETERERERDRRGEERKGR